MLFIHTCIVWQVSAGYSVSDTELEFLWQVFQPTDHHYCGGRDVQGTAQDWQQTCCGPLQVSNYYKQMIHHHSPAASWFISPSSSSDTVSRSGMFCAIATTIDRCKSESVVDVFQVVKAQRIQKPGLVLTVVSTTFISTSHHNSLHHSPSSYYCHIFYNYFFIDYHMKGAVPVCVWSCIDIPWVIWDLL